MGEREISLPTTPRVIEYRAFPATADEAGGFRGYASTWWDVDSYGTAFAPGAFARSLGTRGPKVVILWQHDPTLPIGRPLSMTEDGKGLSVDARISDGTTAGAEALALLRDGVPLALSVGFRTIRERPVDLSNDPIVLDAAPDALKANPERAVVIEEAALYEFSVVTFPANEMAQIAAVRADAQVVALSSALADLRAGRIGPAARALVDELALAWREAPDRDELPAPRPANAPRRIDAETVLARWGHYGQQEGRTWA